MIKWPKEWPKDEGWPKVRTTKSSIDGRCFSSIDNNLKQNFDISITTCIENLGGPHPRFVVLPFLKARTYVRQLNLNSEREYMEWYKKTIPTRIPKYPDAVYKKTDEWISWADWLGCSEKKKKTYSISELKSICYKLKITCPSEYKKAFNQKILPSNFPNYTSLHRFFGKNEIYKIFYPKLEFLPYEKAKIFVHKFCKKYDIKNFKEWRKHIYLLPNNIPKIPDRFYKNNGWSSWYDWLNISPYKDNLKNLIIYAKSKRGILLSKKYFGVDYKYEWKCLFGHIWKAKWEHVRKDHWCPYCAGVKKGFDDIKIIISKRNGKLLNIMGGKFKNNTTKVNIKCKNDHIFDITVASLRRGCWCRYCAKNATKNINDAIKIAKSRYGKCLSSKYINSKSSLSWQCRACVESHI